MDRVELVRHLQPRQCQKASYASEETTFEVLRNCEAEALQPRRSGLVSEL